MMDLSLHSQLQYLGYIDHILALVIVVVGSYYVLVTAMSAVCVQVIENSCMK